MRGYVWILQLVLCLGWCLGSGAADLPADADAAPISSDVSSTTHLSEVVVIAGRSPGLQGETPARISVLDAEQLARLPGIKIDQLLPRISGITSTRSSPSDLRSVVGMRGLGAFEQGRVLVLLDGVPLNKADNGDVNWNRLDPASIERIEVLKGPASSLYGTSAMGGVIYITSRRPTAPPAAEFGTEIGSNQTYAGRLSLSGKLSDAPYGPYMTLRGSYRETDGHRAMSPHARSGLNTPLESEMPLWFDEWSVSPTVGISFDDLTRLEIGYSHYYDRRSEGRRGDDQPNGEYRHFITDAWRLHIESGWDDVRWHTDVYYQEERYYKFYDRPAPQVNTDVDSNRQDLGVILHASAPLFAEHNRLAVGVEVREGRVDARDVDDQGGGFLANSGRMSLVGVYLQDRLDLYDNRLHLTLGLRADVARFAHGRMKTDPDNLFALHSAATSIASQTWTALTPSAGIRYDLSDTISLYATYARGFRAPELDDLCRTGWQYVGPKIANPELEPESIDSFEIGCDWTPANRLQLNATLFYSLGRDFLYYVDTGIPVAAAGYWASRTYQVKQNVGKVRIWGAEIDLRYAASRHLEFYAGYAMSQSRIVAYDTPAFSAATNLEGKSLRDAPQHIVSAGVDLLFPLINITLNSRWNAAAYTDDINSSTYRTDPYLVMDLRAWRSFGDRIRLSLDVMNLLNESHLHTPGGRIDGKSLAATSPGRTWLAALTVTF